MRLYEIDCGRMDFKDMGALFSDTGEYAGQAGTFVDPCFLIRKNTDALVCQQFTASESLRNHNVPRTA